MSDAELQQGRTQNGDTRIDSLKQQIRVNAGLLLDNRPPGSTLNFYEIGIMTADVDAGGGEKGLNRQEPEKFQAILTYRYGINGSSVALAAKGGICATADLAVESLFKVTATALEKYQGNVMRDMSSPEDIASGAIDADVLRRQGKDRSWASIF
ncbi:hypothetical protein KC367_g584 [Hortaea werneckii]|nr:hypothetical protein KC350_g4669 [Hortaea werneckii]KAI6998710.1 hypothetical protein KC329_g1126 [Hortaea werneckii]KAI7046138.1 hypothetical protein KC366_g3165 [Hortaea werneckii]KAI7077656.1 hypothetical protein KC327_g2630 [Hortaea werneckii]KAI7136554.1 hypothetical protein KC337_g2103 [Hortaea werneckii]